MRRPLLVLLLMTLATTLGPAAASTNEFQLLVSDVFADSDYVRVSFQLSDPLPQADVNGPTGSTPAALAYTLELWRQRSGWFDGLISSRTYGYRLDYDHWRDLYRVATPDGRQIEVDRDDLVELLCLQEDVVGARTADLKPGREYYFAITARLTPIDINKLSEVEGWLSGEIRTGTRRGGILGIPKAIVGMLADLAGFGDRSVVARSPVFKANESGPGIALARDR